MLAYHQLGRDVTVAVAGGDQAQDLELAPGQTVVVGFRALPGERADALQVRLRPQPLEVLPRRVQLERRGLLVAEGAAGGCLLYTSPSPRD